MEWMLLKDNIADFQSYAPLKWNFIQFRAKQLYKFRQFFVLRHLMWHKLYANFESVFRTTWICQSLCKMATFWLRPSIGRYPKDKIAQTKLRTQTISQISIIRIHDHDRMYLYGYRFVLETLDDYCVIEICHQNNIHVKYSLDRPESARDRIQFKMKLRSIWNLKRFNTRTNGNIYKYVYWKCTEFTKTHIRSLWFTFFCLFFAWNFFFCSLLSNFRDMKQRRWFLKQINSRFNG